MEEKIPKKRGRKKLIDKQIVKNIELPDNNCNCNPDEETVEKVKKKRGRKKKWETTPFKTNYIFERQDSIKFKEDKDKDKDEDEDEDEDEDKDKDKDKTKNIDKEIYNTDSLTFGNLCIKVHGKEQKDIDIRNYFVDSKNKDCNIVISSDEEDTCLVKEQDKIKKLNIYKNEIKTEIVKNNIKCYYCHNCFDNIPFYLPYEYSTNLNRYKIFGNFCSPNCVKSYCIYSKLFDKKLYIVGQFYRKLFGKDFTITPAPSIYLLKDYGGSLTIEEFRKSFYINKRYTLNNINSKVIYIN
jgi:hypothetical protein